MNTKVSGAIASTCGVILSEEARFIVAFLLKKERIRFMDLQEAILWLKRYQGYVPISEKDGIRRHAFDLTDEVVNTLLAALEEKEGVNHVTRMETRRA